MRNVDTWAEQTNATWNVGEQLANDMVDTLDEDDCYEQERATDDGMPSVD